MRVKIQKEKLENTIRDFHRATGIVLSVLDADFTNIVSTKNVENPFCKIIHQNDTNDHCLFSDMKILTECSRTHSPAMHICHAGLIDIALPIIHNNTIMGYIIMGQMRRDIPFEKIEERLDWISDKKTDLREAYSGMVIYNDECAKSLANLAVMLSSYIMTEDMIKQEHNLLIEKVTSYIHSHINEELSVSDICRDMNVSKNTLYRNFHHSLGISVNEYIINERINLAKLLLRESKEPVSYISEQVGISNSAYFCKIFKKKTGITPLKYRKLN